MKIGSKFPFLGYSVIGISGLVLPQLLSCSGAEKKQAEKIKPNFIIILADDLGWSDVGYHGSEIKTPAIDKIASEGIEFDRFYVHSVCSPTRAALLTGRSPSRFNILAPLGDKPGFPAGTVTIAGLLQGQGYETKITGKWHLGADPEGRPMKFGFNESYGYLHGQIDPYTHLYKTGVKTWHRNDEFVEEEGHTTDLITAEAISFINKQQDSPFFLYVTYSVPHYPLDEPAKWRDMYTGISNKSRAHFAASVSHMDNSIGRILDAVKEKGIGKNTMIMFISDNGGQEEWSSKTDYNGKFEPNDVLGDNKPLRDWKTSLYDGALRVPAILYWEGTLNRMKVNEAINVSDIYPTLANLAGARVPDELNIEGINFWPAVEGKKLPEDRVMYWKLNIGTAVKKGDWKLIRTGGKQKEVTEELYNISADPYETNDLSETNKEKTDELRKELLGQMAKDSLILEVINK